VNRAALERIPQAEWKRIAIELATYAAGKVRRRRWRTGNREDLAKGQTAEDITQEAVALVLSDDRPWDPAKEPDLLQHLRDVVDSLVSNLVTSKDNRLVGRLPETEDGVVAEEMLKRARPGAAHAEHLTKAPVSAEQEVVAAEEEAVAAAEEERIAGEVFAAASGDQELERVVEAIMDGHGKAAEIAAATGFQVKRVYQLLRTLKRHVASRARAKAGAGA
jgi:hypothetical protein